jgi:hypothetical protein
MATIDQEGLIEVKKVKDALNHMHTKITTGGVDVNEEYSFIFKILTQMEDEWEHNINRVYTVPDELNINGKTYSSKS